MALRVSAAVVIILSSLKLQSCRGGLLPVRAASSPNEIDSVNGSSDKIQDSSKTVNRFSNVQEKPNTDNYNLLEIELREGVDKSALRFGEILREVLRGGDELSVKKISGLKKIVKNLKKNGTDREKEKLYYLKKSKSIPSSDVVTVRKWTSWEPRSYLKSINYDPTGEKRYATKSFYRPKKYRGDVPYRPSYYTGQILSEDNERDENRNNTYDFVSDSYKSGNESTDDVNTTEYYLPPTSSELPKQIPPPPPGQIPSQTIFSHTTPVLRSMSRRTDILPHGLTI